MVVGGIVVEAVGQCVLCTIPDIFVGIGGGAVLFARCSRGAVCRTPEKVLGITRLISVFIPTEARIPRTCSRANAQLIRLPSRLIAKFRVKKLVHGEPVAFGESLARVVRRRENPLCECKSSPRQGRALFSSRDVFASRRWNRALIHDSLADFK